MDPDAYRRAYFADPPPEPRFAFTGAFGVTLYVQDFAEAVAYYAAALGPPAYVERDGTRLRVTLNGTTILDEDVSKLKPLDGKEHPGQSRKSGYVGFAGHNDPVAFRNVRIKVLK